MYVAEPGERDEEFGLAAARRANEEEPYRVAGRAVRDDGGEYGVQRRWVWQVQPVPEYLDGFGELAAPRRAAVARVRFRLIGHEDYSLGFGGHRLRLRNQPAHLR